MAEQAVCGCRCDLAACDQPGIIRVGLVDNAMMRFQPFQNAAFKRRQIGIMAIPDEGDRLQRIICGTAEESLDGLHFRGGNFGVGHPQICQSLQMGLCPFTIG